MTDKEIIANLLRGQEQREQGLTEALHEVVDIVDRLTKEYQKKGFEDETAVFMAIKTFEILFKMKGEN